MAVKGFGDEIFSWPENKLFEISRQWDSLRDCIALLAETPRMVVNGLFRNPMLFTPDFNFQAAGLTVLDQVEPFLVGTFDTFLSHVSSPLLIYLE